MKKLTLEQLDVLSPEKVKEYVSGLEIGERIDLIAGIMSLGPSEPVRHTTLVRIYNQMISEMCGILMHQADTIALFRPTSVN